MSTFRQKVQAATSWGAPGAQDQAGRPDLQTRSPRPRPAAPAAITTHPLFPAFAALWFAALFGLGSMAISSAALGALVTMIGLPALVPAAAPPLGFTAHLLVAFALTVVGAVFGLVLALRLRPQAAADTRFPEVARPAAQAATRPAPQPEADLPPKVRARDAHPDAPPRRPLVLTEAFDEPLEAAGNDPVEAPAPLLRRKPGQAASAVLASEPEPWIPVFTPGGEAAVRPLDLAALDLADVAEALVPFAEPQAPVEVAAEPEPEAPEVPEAVVMAPEPAAPPVLLAATPQLPRDLAAALPEAVDGSWSPVAGLPLGSLGLVQLIERLALAIAARKAASEAQAAAAVAAEPEPAIAPEPETETAEPDFVPGPFSQPAFAHRAMSAPANVPSSDAPSSEVPQAGSAREAILRRLGALAAGDADPAADQAPLFSRPARIVLPTGPAEAVVPLHAVDAAPEPVSPRGPAAFAPPSPGSAPAGAAAPVPFEADDALRSALATLQRMTARG